MRLANLIACMLLSLAVGLSAEGLSLTAATSAQALSPVASALSLSPTASATPVLIPSVVTLKTLDLRSHAKDLTYTVVEATAWPSDYHGFILSVGLAQAWVDGAAPLSYRLDLGWQFRGGWVVKTGMDNWYYKAEDFGGTNNYAVNDWVTSLQWVMPLKSALQPSFGLAFESAFGTYQADKALDNGSQPSGSISPMSGISALLGLSYRIDPEWQVDLQGRGLASLTTGHLCSLGLAFDRLF